MGPANWNNIWPISSISHLAKLVEKAVVLQLQEVLDLADYLDVFQFEVIHGLGTEIALGHSDG